MRKRSLVYWLGLIITTSASLALFGLLWMVLIAWKHYEPYPQNLIRTPFIPAVVAGIVFILLGIYMMITESKP